MTLDYHSSPRWSETIAQMFEMTKEYYVTVRNDLALPRLVRNNEKILLKSPERH